MNKLHSGQSIYEVVVAIGIITFALLAMVGMVISSIAATTYTRNKSNANRYTQEAIEWLRSERNADWDTFFNNATSHASASGTCVGSLNWTAGSCTIVDTIYRRRMFFNVTLNPTVEIDVRVETQWDDGRGTHVSEASTTFTNWITQ